MENIEDHRGGNPEMESDRVRHPKERQIRRIYPSTVISSRMPILGIGERCRVFDLI